MILHLSNEDAYNHYTGFRVRVLWNPQVKLWYVYSFDRDDILFSTSRLELHTVSVYGELKPKFAANGTPSFVGTIASYEIVEKGEHHEVRPHPYAPAKMFFVGAEEDAVEFSFSQRILLDGGKMLAFIGKKYDVTNRR